MSGKTGRPVIEALAGDKVTLSLRTTATNKGRLVAAAKAGGRNLSEEMERRLEASFRNDEVLQRLDRIENALIPVSAQSAGISDVEQELRRRARAVVDARYDPGKSWEDISNAIGDLAELVGGGEL